MTVKRRMTKAEFDELIAQDKAPKSFLNDRVLLEDGSFYTPTLQDLKEQVRRGEIEVVDKPEPEPSIPMPNSTALKNAANNAFKKKWNK